MIGLDASTGKQLSGMAHLRQSVRDILTTPIGTRVMRRDYGSRLYQLVDAPMNDATRLDMMAATYEALETWEPRLCPRLCPQPRSQRGQRQHTQGRDRHIPAE